MTITKILTQEPADFLHLTNLRHKECTYILSQIEETLRDYHPRVTSDKHSRFYHVNGQLAALVDIIPANPNYMLLGTLYFKGDEEKRIRRACGSLCE